MKPVDATGSVRFGTTLQCGGQEFLGVETESD